MENNNYLKTLIHFASETIKEPNNYKECYVAFIDILGFKDIIAKTACDRLKMTVYDEIRKITTLFHSDLFNYFLPDKTREQIETVLMSDSIVISIPQDVEYAFEAIGLICIMIQRFFITRKNPIIMRGGLSQGEFYHYNQITYGPALVSAYILENQSQYPRIIIDPKINLDKSFTEKDNIVKSFCSLDYDGFYYFDYIRLAYTLAEERQIKENIVMFIRENLRNKKLKNKYRWLAKQHNRALSFIKSKEKKLFI